MRTIQGVVVVMLVVLFCGEAFAQAMRPPEMNDPDPLKLQELGAVGGRWPSLSPDGRIVAFSLQSDLWIMPATGGRALRLTLNEANDIKPVWSPDGRTIAFTSDRSGSFDIWTIPSEGGTPTRLTFDAATDHICDFSPDGSKLLFQSARNGTWQLFEIPVSGGTPSLVTLDEDCAAGSYGPQDWYYYQYSVSDTKRKGYRGSANDDIYRCKRGAIPERLTENNQNDRQPFSSPDGRFVFFLRETGVTGKDYNLFVMDTTTRAVQQLTELDAGGMNYLSLNASRTRAFFTWKFRIHTIDLTAHGLPLVPTLVPVRIVEDGRRDPLRKHKYTSGADDVDVSADGSTMVLVLAGSVWAMSAAGGEAHQITPDGGQDSGPRISPSGKTVAFFSSERTGNSDIFLVDIDGSNLRRITSAPSDEHFLNWSPDGLSLVFSSTRSGNKDIWRLNLVDGKPEQLTQTPYPDDDPSVSPDGTLVAYDSWAEGNADIFVMNADGSAPRKVYGTPAQEESPRFSPDGKLLVFNRSSDRINFKREVVVTDLRGSGEVVVAEGHGGSFSPDGSEIYYVDAEGEIRAVPSPRSINGGRKIPFLATREVPQTEQFKRTFTEAWTLIANNFYDKNFHGVDWQAMYRKYAPVIAQVGSRQEFYHFTTEMIGELNASHQDISGEIADVQRYSTGLLGCGFEPEVLAVDDRQPGAPRQVRLRVASIEAGGPMDKAWIRTGDFVFGVPNHRLQEGESFERFLEGTAEREITILVGSKPDGSDIREVKVTPEGVMTMRTRRYKTWENTCKESVRKASDGHVAYVHLQGMMPPDLAKFTNELGRKETQAAQALVLDLRGNTGGRIHQQMIDILSRKFYATNIDRSGESASSPELYWDRPVVLLIDHSSYSDAEVFPHAFKHLKLGTIVGETTNGSVIGTRDITLSDGSNFRVTSTGFINPDGVNQEGNGCTPDIEVLMSAEDRILKRDPQLDKAIAVALEKVAGGPAKEPGPETPAEPEEDHYASKQPTKE